MTYEAWRISYQSSEQAARAAYAECWRLRAEIGAMKKLWLSPEAYHILMQEREDILFQAEKMKQRAPCKDISMWPNHHTQPAQPAPSVLDGWKLVPTEPTKEMRAAWDSSPVCEDDAAEFRRAYMEMLDAAPEAKP